MDAFTNIQLVQKFASDRLFEKLHKIPLSHWVTYADVFHELSEDERNEVVYVVDKVSEWRRNRQQIETIGINKD